jgi:ribonuclease HI
LNTCNIDGDKNREAVIYTDSLSAIISIKEGRSQSRPNLVNKIIAKYNSLHRIVHLVWILSHVNIHGNEEADRLAKEALKQHNVYGELLFEARELNEQINV